MSGRPDRIHLEMATVLYDIALERERQIAKWGKQHHPDGTGDQKYHAYADNAKKQCALAVIAGNLTWRAIMDEELLESYAETPNSAEQRQELIQAAAVLVAWIEDIDSRGKR